MESSTSRPEARAGLSDALRDLIYAFEGFRAAATAYLGVGETDSMTLSMLNAAGGELGQTEIAGRLNITTSAVTSLIDRLQTAGYAERQPHPEDRRRAVVQISELGRGRLSDVRGWFASALDEVTDDQLDQATELLRTIGTGLGTQSTGLAQATPSTLVPN